MEKYIETNRAHWDDAVAPHVASQFYDVASFKAGRNALLPIERAEVGDVSGKSLLHVQCHFGMDTLSWALLGARATGIDFAPSAIAQARALATELGIEARFIESNVYELPDKLDERFDIVFASYGVTCWLPDFPVWAKVVAGFVKPGGFVYLIDAHPVLTMLDYEKPLPALRFSYFDTGPALDQSDGTYATAERLAHDTTYQFQHTTEELINAFIDADLRIDFVHEFPYAAWAALPAMQKRTDGYYSLPDGVLSVPLMMSIKASSPP